MKQDVNEVILFCHALPTSGRQPLSEPELQTFLLLSSLTASGNEFPSLILHCVQKLPEVSCSLTVFSRTI